jgi:hypothetical protein
MRGRCRDSGPIDFEGRQIGLYVLYQRDELMYVGRSGDGKHPSISGRLRYHYKEDKYKIGKWDRHSWFGFLSAAKLSEQITISMSVGEYISDIEALLIHLNQPKWNLSPGKHRHIQEFEQIPD